MTIFQLEIEFDLNSNALSILHSSFIHIAKDFILHDQMATIYSWGFMYDDTNQTPNEHNANYIHVKRKMDIIIEDSELCDNITKKEKFEKSGQYNQMCGRPLVEGQQIILVNMMITFNTFKYFLIILHVLKMNALYILDKSLIFYMFYSKILVVL